MELRKLAAQAVNGGKPDQQMLAHGPVVEGIGGTRAA